MSPKIIFQYQFSWPHMTTAKHYCLHGKTGPHTYGNVSLLNQQTYGHTVISVRYVQFLFVCQGVRTLKPVLLLT